MPKRKRSHEYCRNRFGIFKQRRVISSLERCDDYRLKKNVDAASPREPSGDTTAKALGSLAPFQIFRKESSTASQICASLLSNDENKRTTPPPTATTKSSHDTYTRSLVVLTSLLRLSEETKEHSPASSSSSKMAALLSKPPGSSETRMSVPHDDYSLELSSCASTVLAGSQSSSDGPSNVEEMVDVSHHQPKRPLHILPNNSDSDDDSDEGFCDEPVTKRPHRLLLETDGVAEPDEGVNLVEELSADEWTRRKRFKRTNQEEDMASHGSVSSVC